jgi:hypothetical protein
MKIERGKKALTGKSFRHNIEVMKNDGYSTKRAQGMAYGEAGLAKRAMKEKKEMEKKKAEHAKHKERHSHHLKKASEMLKKADSHLKDAKKAHTAMKKKK